MFSIFWFSVPVLYEFSRKLFIKIPTPFYKLWMVDNVILNNEYWNNVDTFRLMQVRVKIKRNESANSQSSFSVKVPEDIALGRWFNRFIEDQNIRFPNKNIELYDKDGEEYGWVFYTQKWLPIPLFTRLIDFDEDIVKNKIKNKGTIYIKRVSKNKKEVDENMLA
jgi:hypothetical protein